MIYNVIEAVILGMSVLLICWVARTVIDHGQELSTHRTQININTARVGDIDLRGSRATEGLANRLDTITKQVDEMRLAIVALQAAPGELKAINVRLDSIKEGQGRIEKQLDEHMRKESK